MSRFRLCALAAALAALALSAPGEAASRSKLCRQAPCHVVLRDGPITVVRAVARLNERHPNVEPFLRTIACWRSRNTCKWLGDETQDTLGLTARPLASAGRFLVYGLRIAGKEGPDPWRVCRLDVATGRLEMVGSPGGFFSLHGGLLSIVVTPSGGVGWIAGGEALYPVPGGEPVVSSARQVYALPSGSRTPRLLASSPAVEAGSLAASDNRLYWSEGGAAKEAPL
ncbi:MAG: hypothetical protein JWM60_1695 [Solirubrobacterales bacterium]|nr:hypothetical protein [Solirubrobacterales bacterium]